MKIQVTFSAQIIDNNRRGVDLEQCEINDVAESIRNLLHSETLDAGRGKFVNFYDVRIEAKSGENETKS